ncbi:MAG: hypothetical protein BAA01_09805 [Bacillus thermozeamaize]|uniref:Ribose ABC transporter permease n=1 Tax=Bacillus thermozeamaize TaxID=230954 RepID=A0A1Y3PJW2_9BACI|nr:MAG: hypothetical protein BAA01_09805 [Bacillus thermozeamaize]
MTQTAKPTDAVEKRVRNISWGQIFVKYGNLIALALLVIIASILSEHFLTLNNIFNIFRQVAVLGIVSIGMTLVILNRGIDLSVGSVLALCGVLAGLVHEQGFWISLLVVLLAGGLCGAINGCFVTQFNMQPFIATLVMFIAARGVALWITDGRYISDVTTWAWLSGGNVGPIPIPMIIMIALFLLFGFLLNRTVWGRQIYAVGGNAEAARLSGINVRRNQLSVYIVAGLLVGFASMINDARVWSADPQAGHLLELDAISAVLIGGTTFDGGRGTLLGTFIGVLILQIMSNIMNLLGVSIYPQMVIKGVIIATAVIVSQFRSSSK